MASEARFFITVEWCNDGRRGVFCNANGSTWNKVDGPHTDAEILRHLGPFWPILDGRSELLTIEQVKERNHFRPLAEYSGQCGIAMTKETYEKQT